MILVLSCLGIILAAAGFFLSDPVSAENQPSWKSIGIAMVTAIVLAGLAKSLHFGENEPDGFLGVAAGVGASLLLTILARFKSIHPVVSIGLAVGSAGLLSGIPHFSVAGFVLGSAAIALTVGVDSVAVFSLAGGAVASALLFGTVDAEVSPAGVQLGILIAIGAFGALFLKNKAVLAAIVVTVLAIGGIAYVSLQAGKANNLFAVAAPLGGLAVHLLLAQDDKKSSLSSMIAALIWAALATVGYATGKSAGITLALIAGAGIPLALGNMRAAGSVAPLSALVWYRLVRQTDPELARGSDLTTFYLLIGLVVGVGLCATAWEWRAQVEEEKGTVGGALWSFLTAGAAVFVQLVFGAKGLSGLLVGSGLGSLGIQQGKREMTPTAITAIVGGTAALAFHWADQKAPQDHDIKVKLFALSGVGFMALGAILFLLQRSPEKAEAA